MELEVKLVIETDRLSAIELSEILRALDRSFVAFIKRKRGLSIRPRLAVSAVHYGSIQIILDAIPGYEDLMEAREYLAPFFTHLAHVAELATGGKLQKLGSETLHVDRKAVRSIVAPVANGHATQANVLINGNLIFNVPSQESAKEIIEGLQSLRTAQPSDGLGAIAMSAQSEEREVSKALAPAIVTREQLNELERGSLMGTAFRVSGIWYARLLDGQGVLVPISAAPSTLSVLEHDATYAFRGKPMHGWKGETIGIRVDGATLLGNEPQSKG